MTKRDIEQLAQETKGDFDQLAQATKHDIGQLSLKVDHLGREVRLEVEAGFAGVRADLHQEIAALRSDTQSAAPDAADRVGRSAGERRWLGRCTVPAAVGGRGRGARCPHSARACSKRVIARRCCAQVP